jgi:hypothetical protein
MITPLITFAGADQKAQIGPFEVDIKFCEDAQAISTLTNAFQQTQWPVAGAPGIAMGIIQNTNQVMEFCKYLIMLDQLTNARGAYQTMQALNALTDSRWAQEMDFLMSTYDLGQSVVDFGNAKGRKNLMYSRIISSRLKRFNKNFMTVYNKRIPANDSEIAEITKIAQKKALLGEILQCKKPTKDNDWGKVYEKEILPLESRIDESKEDFLFYQGRLEAMGEAMLPPNMINEFVKELYSLPYDVYPYNITNKETSEPTIRKTGKTTVEKRAELQTANVKRTIQDISLGTNGKYRSDFIAKWSGYWGSFTVDKYLTVDEVDDKSRFGFDKSSATMSVDNTMKKLIFDCPPSAVKREVDYKYRDSKILREPLRDRDERVVFNECVAETRVTSGFTNRGFDNFLRKYLENARKWRTDQATYWTKQSLYLGINVSVDNYESDTVPEQVTCNDKYEVAEMQRIQMEQNQTILDYQEKSVEYLKRLSDLEVMKLEKEKAELAEAERRNRVSIKPVKNADSALTDSIFPR